MANSGPPPRAKRKAGLGCHDSGPGESIIVVALRGVPITPSRTARSAVWIPAPSTVSGAQATRSPTRSACSSSSVARRGRLVPDVLAGVERLVRDVRVGGRDGEVHDDLDGVVGEQLLDGAG